ncbi:MAG TPA: alpha-L-fucosidase [Bacteroidales bacterium]|nr:alpha-L-fucosidase [Bacteroidales bacterium]
MKRILFVFLFAGILSSFYAQTGYTPAEENLANRKWFQDAKFGMFIHWGVYSVLGDGEWVMNTQQIDKKTYEKLPAFFNPIDYNPAEWVALARQAGMKYIVITSKHHDGFAMFDSKQTDWDIMDRTPYKKDVLKMLADECQKQGIRLFFYHSQLDWYQNDYYPRGNTGSTAGRPESGNWNNYLKFMNAQLTELLTNYGQIGGIWFDGWWDKKDADWQLDETYSLIHRLQPGCMIGSNHHQAPKPGEDFQMFEKDLPGFNTTGFSGESKVGSLPLETCETMNYSWGFNLQDKNFKSSRALIQYLVRAAGYNSNFLLNVGPMPNGKIQPEFVDTLKKIGNWMNQFGETIYGTRQGPVTPKTWGVTTEKEGRIFVHLLNSEGNTLLIPSIGKIQSVKLFHNQQKVSFIETKLGTIIQIPEGLPSMPDVVFEITLKS